MSDTYALVFSVVLGECQQSAHALTVAIVVVSAYLSLHDPTYLPSSHRYLHPLLRSRNPRVVSSLCPSLFASRVTKYSLTLLIFFVCLITSPGNVTFAGEERSIYFPNFVVSKATFLLRRWSNMFNFRRAMEARQARSGVIVLSTLNRVLAGRCFAPLVLNMV